MSGKDNDGRPYATVAGTQVGTMLQADGDFTCLRKGAKREVLELGGELYVDCRDGGHLLAGQLSEDGTHYVGFYTLEGGK